MIISGADDGKVYIWNKETDYVPEINPMYIDILCTDLIACY